MKTISSISKKSLANLFAITGALYGLVIGIFMLVFAGIGGTMMGGMRLQIFGGLALIIAPLVYGLLGYLSGYLMAALYNSFIVPKFGGLEIELN